MVFPEPEPKGPFQLPNVFFLTTYQDAFELV